jgi:hypothetical protein
MLPEGCWPRLVSVTGSCGSLVSSQERLVDPPSFLDLACLYIAERHYVRFFVSLRVLPVADGISDAIIAAQADVPTSGNTWYLTLRYSCTIVAKLSNFTILNKRDSTAELIPNADKSSWLAQSYYTVDTQLSYIAIRNSTLNDVYANNFG